MENLHNSLQAFFATSDPSTLTFPSSTLPIPLFTLLSQLPFSPSQISLLKQKIFSTFDQNFVSQILQFSQQVALSCESYKARRFAVFFDPQKQVVFERLIDRTVAVRSAAVTCAIQQGFLSDEILAIRFISVLEKSVKLDDIVEGIDFQSASPVVLQYFVQNANSAKVIEKLAEMKQLSVIESFQREGDAFLVKFLEKIISGENDGKGVVELLNGVIEGFSTLPCGVNSVRYENNVNLVNFLEKKVKELGVNRNVLAQKLQQVECDDSFGGISLMIFVGQEEVDYFQLLKNNKNYQKQQEIKQNIAIFQMILQKLMLNVHKNLAIINDIIVNYLNKTDSFIAEKHVLMLNFIFVSLTANYSLYEDNHSDITEFIKLIDSQLSSFYSSSKTNFSTDSDFYFQIVSIATGLVNQIAYFQQNEEIFTIVLHIRNTLGKLTTMISLPLFQLKFSADLPFLRKIYVYTILGVNISLITPSVKDYNFDVLNQWVNQLVDQVNIYSEDTFLKSLIYGNYDDFNAEIIAFTIENVLDLIHVLLLFGNRFDTKTLFVQISRLVYHITNSKTLSTSINLSQFIQTNCQPILYKIFEISSLSKNFIHFGVLSGLISANLDFGQKFIVFILKQLISTGTETQILFEILGGMICVSDESIDEICQFLSTINPLPALFLGGKASKSMAKTTILSKLSDNDRLCCQLQLQKLGVDVECENTEIAAAERSKYVKEINKVSKVASQVVDEVYE